MMGRHPKSSPSRRAGAQGIYEARGVGRRAVLCAGAALLAVPFAGEAQRAERSHRIGFVSPTPRGPRNDAFVRGLRELGYVEGHNVSIEMRFADGRPERLPGLVEELIRLKPDVLVVGATIGARAAKSATTTIPVVFAGSSDPVAAGIVSNLARPEGNITGISLAYGDGLAGKWLELLKEIVPGAAHVAAVWSSTNSAASRLVDELRVAARTMNVGFEPHDATNPAELDVALSAIGSSGAQGLIVCPSPFAATHAEKLVQFAAGKRVPAIYFVEDFVEAGGLMSYGPSIADAYRKAARHVDRILRGAKPKDLPVEQPTRFELIINLKTAGNVGVGIPKSLLLRADRLIE
jgi:putative ABC transport system substrate-binding protein